jgi:hypothetical protein
MEVALSHKRRALDHLSSASHYYLNGLGPHEVKLIAHDAYNNEESCTATVWVEESRLCRAPRAVCHNVSVAAQEGCFTRVHGWSIGGQSVGENLSFFLNETFLNGVGRYPIELTVADQYNHSDTCSASVVVQESIYCNGSKTLTDETPAFKTSPKRSIGLIVGMTIGIVAAVISIFGAWVYLRHAKTGSFSSGLGKVNLAPFTGQNEVEAAHNPKDERESASMDNLSQPVDCTV